MRSEHKLSSITSRWAMQSTARLLATYSLIMGLVITFGGAERFEGDSFRIAMMVPGSPPTWGIAILVLGVLTLIGTLTGAMRMVEYCMYGCAIWTLCFEISFIISAITDDGAALTAIVSYGFIFTLFTIVGAVYRDSRKSLPGSE